MVRRRFSWLAAVRHKVSWRALVGEFFGTAALIALGLSVVIFNFSPHAPLASLLNSPARRALTGFLFGSVGALVTISPLGKASGAHLNPIVTLAFVLQGKMARPRAATYVVAQCLGATAGAATLLVWGSRGKAVLYGATVPGSSYGAAWAFAGEVATSGAMVLLLLIFLGTRRLRRFTPALFPPLYALMVFLEAPVSGTSTNPARSLGPALVAGAWQSWWVYWVGPALGCVVALIVFRSPLLGDFEVELARVYHFAEAEVTEFADRDGGTRPPSVARAFRSSTGRRTARTRARGNRRE